MLDSVCESARWDKLDCACGVGDGGGSSSGLSTSSLSDEAVDTVVAAAEDDGFTLRDIASSCRTVFNSEIDRKKLAVVQERTN